MSFEITGKLVVKYDTSQKSETFKTREFVIEKSEDIGGRVISNFVKFQCVQDKTSLPDKFNLGDDVKVFFNIRGTKWAKEGKESYFTNLDAWRMETIKLTAENDANIPPAFVPQTVPDDVVDDLPF